MDSTIAWKDDVYVLNYCTKYLARDSADPRHNFGQYSPGDPSRGDRRGVALSCH